RDVLHAVAVPHAVTRDLVVLAQRARDDEPDAALLEDIRRAVADARLRTCVRRAREAERALVEVRSLLRVSDPELEMIPPEQGHEVLRHAGNSRRGALPPHAGTRPASRCRR